MPGPIPLGPCRPDLRRYDWPPRFESREHLVDDRDPVVDVGDARRGPGEGDGVIAFGPGADRPRKNDQAGKWAVSGYLEPVQPGAARERGVDRLLDVAVGRDWEQRDREVDAHDARHGRAGEVGLVALELPGGDAGQGEEACLNAGMHGRGDEIA